MIQKDINRFKRTKNVAIYLSTVFINKSTGPTKTNTTLLEEREGNLENEIHM